MKRADGWISCRKCAKWDHGNCIGWPEKALDHLSAVLVKKSSMKLILEQKFMYPTVPQEATKLNFTHRITLIFLNVYPGLNL